MVLDYLEVGVVVELAFGIFFDCIVPTLALAVGLGSRDLISHFADSSVAQKAGTDNDYSVTLEEREPARKRFNVLRAWAQRIAHLYKVRETLTSVPLRLGRQS
jgi:hypothetical protein